MDENAQVGNLVICIQGKVNGATELDVLRRAIVVLEEQHRRRSEPAQQTMTTTLVSGEVQIAINLGFAAEG